MAAPRKSVHRNPTNITLDPKIKAQAKEYASSRGGLAKVVERLLEKAIELDREGVSIESLLDQAASKRSARKRTKKA